MSDKVEDPDGQKDIKRCIHRLNIHKILSVYGESDPLSWTSEAMMTNMIVLLCLSALFPVLMCAEEVKSDFLYVKDCSDIYASGYSTSGVYTITTADGPVQVYCDVEAVEKIETGHWLVFLRRMDGEVNFFRRWESYKTGFGNKTGEHWLGLELLHQLTRKDQYKLRVDLEDFDGNKAYAVYKSFSVGSESEGYKLQVSGFVNGGAGDSLYYHNGMKFSTYDNDQDNSGSNCAMIYFGGGFWYNKCYYTNPTGHYLWENDGTLMDTGATWYYWKNSWNPLKSITMKIKRVK
ncbi:microfibril-associated glycoprotein 4-like [Carassius gibelio]|uniref:microfibril-associated glycoprotein 4-like n=1 Tax=Carassius gibelio TaxID=101364 RepID=UPI002277778F|nr:microfibril-associated glycoprotein 4-like [Carassius gibelio]